MFLDTKKQEKYTLPLYNYLYELLLSCCQKKTNEYIFPGTGAAGHIIEPQQIIDYFLKCMGVQSSTTVLEIQPQQGVVHE